MALSAKLFKQRLNVGKSIIAPCAWAGTSLRRRLRSLIFHRGLLTAREGEDQDEKAEDVFHLVIILEKVHVVNQNGKSID